MNQNEVSVLESKFKRHKIKYQIQGNKIMIGKAKTNYIAVLGFIIAPLPIFLGIVYYISVQNIALIQKLSPKIMLIALSILSFSTFYAWKLIFKKRVNANTKTLYNKSLKIESKNAHQSFDKRNIKKIGFASNYTENETYEGGLFLLDDQDNIHPLLGFNDDNETYLNNDLKWFAEFFAKHLEIQHKIVHK